MREPEPYKPPHTGTPEPSGAARQRRGPHVPRTRRRPTVQPARKPILIIPEGSTVASGDDRHEGSLGVEMRPIGGIFGTSSSLEVPEEGRRRLLRVPKSLRLRRGGEEKEASLLDDPDFRMLWLSRLLSQTAQGALLYALLILVVDLSNRSFFNSLFVACSMIPSLLFGLPAGLVVDTMPRKYLLVMLNGFRFLFMLFLVGSEPSLAGVFAATLGIWIIHQFYSPSESSMLADLVPPSRYTSAQALFNLALTISQALGLVILAPLMLRVGGPELVFVMAGALWCVAGALTVLLPSIAVDQSATRRPRRRGLRESLGDGWRFVRGDRLTFEAIVDDVVVSVGMSALVVIIPFYLERVLGTSKENTVFVFAPAALGLVAGLRLAPFLSRIIGERYAAFLSVLVFAACVASLGFVEQMYTFITQVLRFPLDQITDVLSISPTIFLAMLISIPAGLASSIINVAARSILLQRSPVSVRGQVIATQGLIGNVVGLVPTLLAGIATDVFGVVPVAVAIGVLIVIAAGLAHGFGSGRSAPVVPAPLT